MDDVQSYWEVPCIAHFCSLYRKTFDLLDFDIEELEEALLCDSSDEEIGNSLIQDLIVRLLRGCFSSFNSQQKDDITSFNYQMYLRRLFRIKCEEDSSRRNPFNRDIAFHSLPLRSRVELLHDLCNFRLEADEVPDSLKLLEADSLRVRPLGKDSGGSTYWYFYGTRLYREDYYTKTKSCPPKKRGKRGGKPELTVTESRWEIACTTEEDWQLLTNKFKNCKNKDERALYERLRDHFLPELPRLFAEREKLMSKRMMDSQRRSNRAVSSAIALIPRSPTPPPLFPPQKSSSALFDELQTKKQIEEKEAAKKKVEGNSTTKEEETKSAVPESHMSEVQLQRQKEEQEKADRLFAEQLEREERMARLHLRERRPSGTGSRARSGGTDYSFAISFRDSKTKSSHRNRASSGSPNRSSSSSKKTSSSTKRTKGSKKVGSKGRMTNNSLSASLGDGESDEETSGKEDEEGEIHSSSSDSDSDTDTDTKKKKKAISTPSKESKTHSPSKKDIQKRVFSGSSKKHKGSGTPEKKKRLGSESDLKSSSTKSSKKSGANISTKSSSAGNLGFGVGSSKTKVKSSYLFSQNEEDVVIGMHKVIEAVKMHRDAWPFVNPVDEEYAPNYYSVVKEPMDLQKMEDKLDNHEYHSVDEFKSDFQKIADNCRLYNGASSEYTEMVEAVEEAFHKNMLRFMIQDESDDEEFSIEYGTTDTNEGGHRKKIKKNNSSAAKAKPDVKRKTEEPPALKGEEIAGKKDKPKLVQEKAKKEKYKETIISSKSKETQSSSSASSKTKDNKKSKKELLMRHHSHKSDKDGRKVVSATAEALKDMNKWLGETTVGIPPKKKKKKEKRPKRDDDSCSVSSSLSVASNSSVHKTGSKSKVESAIKAETHSLPGQSDSFSKNKKILKNIDKEVKLNSSRDEDDKNKPVKKRHRHHSSSQPKHSSSTPTASTSKHSHGDKAEKDHRHHHHHHHHHHHNRHHSFSSASGNTDRESSGEGRSKKRASSSSSAKIKKVNLSTSPCSSPVRKSSSTKLDKKDGDKSDKSASTLLAKDSISNLVKRKPTDTSIKSAPRKPLMKRSISLLQGFKQSGSIKRLQIGKATKFNIKNSTSTSFDSDNSKDGNGTGKPEFLPPWKRVSAKLLASDSSGNVLNRTLSASAASDVPKWQQERNSDSRFSWLKAKKEGGGPKLSLGTVLPKHVINLSGLQYNENGLSDNDQNGSAHEEDEDDDDEDLYAKLERGLANLSRGRLSDKTRQLIAANPSIAARIALGGIEKAKEEEKKSEEPAKNDRKLEPAKGFNAEKSLPNLSAWFKAFGAPNSSSTNTSTATGPVASSTIKEDSNCLPSSSLAGGNALTKPKFRVMGRTPGGIEKKGTSNSNLKSVDASNVKGEQQMSVGGGSSVRSPPAAKIEESSVRESSETKVHHGSHRNRKVSTSSMSSQSEMGSPAVYYGGVGGNSQESSGLVINPPRWTDSAIEQHNWGSQSQSPSASSQVSSQSPAGPNSPFSPPISSPPETPPRPIGPVRVGFYQDITNSSSQHSSPEKAGSNESPQSINVTSPATPPNSAIALHHRSPSKRDATGSIKGYQSYGPPSYGQRYSGNSNPPSPGPTTPGNNASIGSPPSSVEARSDSPPASNKTYTHLESSKHSGPESIPPRVMYDPPRWSPYPPGHPLYQHHPLPRAHLTSAAAGSPHAELFSPNPPSYNASGQLQPEAAHSRNNSRYTPSISSGPQAAHSNSQPQAAHQYSSVSASSSSPGILRAGNPCLIQSQIPSYSTNPYASNPRNVNIPPNIYNNPIADRLGMVPMSSAGNLSSSALTLTNTTSTTSSLSRGKRGHQQQQQGPSDPQSKGAPDVGVMNGFQWPNHPMAGLTHIVNNLPNSMNPYITRGAHHPHYDPEAMAKYARSGVVDPIGYTNLSASGSAKSSLTHPEQLVAKSLVNLSSSSSSAPTANETHVSTETPPPEKKRRGRGEGKKTKAAKAEAAAAAQQHQQQQAQSQQQTQQQQPIVPGSAFNFSSISGSLYPKDVGENSSSIYSASSPSLPIAHSHHHRSSSEHLYPASSTNFHQPFVSSARSGSTTSSGTPGPTPSPYSIPPYIGSHPSPYHQSQPSQGSPFGASPRGIVDPYQQFFPGSPHVLPLLPPTSSYAQAYAAAAASTHPSAAAHGLGLRPGWI